MDKEASQIMSDAYDRWARELLGVPPLKNAEVCKSEIGWNQSAEGKAVYEAALVRCAFWKQSRDTLAGHHFISSIFKLMLYFNCGELGQELFGSLRAMGHPGLARMGL